MPCDSACLSSLAEKQLIEAHLKGASPVPGPIMMLGVLGKAVSRKSGLAYMYTGTLSPTCAAPPLLQTQLHQQAPRRTQMGRLRPLQVQGWLCADGQQDR